MELSWPGITIAACLTVLIGLLLTHPVELRPGRWQRIAITLPFACWIGNALAQPNAVVRGIYAICSFFFIGFYWREVFAHYIADGLIHNVMGFSKWSRGAEMDLQYVKSAIRFKEPERAIELLEEELLKEPHSYEGLLLLSSLNGELKRWKPAIAALELLLLKGRLSNEQREHVADLKKKLEDTLLVEQLNAR